MNALDIIDEHIIVRETIGYEGIKEVKVYDLPEVIKFLKIVYNYQRMINLENKIEMTKKK